MRLPDRPGDWTRHPIREEPPVPVPEGPGPSHPRTPAGWEESGRGAEGRRRDPPHGRPAHARRCQGVHELRRKRRVAGPGGRVLSKRRHAASTRRPPCPGCRMTGRGLRGPFPGHVVRRPITILWAEHPLTAACLHSASRTRDATAERGHGPGLRVRRRPAERRVPGDRRVAAGQGQGPHHRRHHALLEMSQPPHRPAPRLADITRPRGSAVAVLVACRRVRAGGLRRLPQPARIPHRRGFCPRRSPRTGPPPSERETGPRSRSAWRCEARCWGSRPNDSST